MSILRLKYKNIESFVTVIKNLGEKYYHTTIHEYYTVTFQTSCGNWGNTLVGDIVCAKTHEILLTSSIDITYTDCKINITNNGKIEFVSKRIPDAIVDTIWIFDDTFVTRMILYKNDNEPDTNIARIYVFSR